MNDPVPPEPNHEPNREPAPGGPGPTDPPASDPRGHEAAAADPTERLRSFAREATAGPDPTDEILATVAGEVAGLALGLTRVIAEVQKETPATADGLASLLPAYGTCVKLANQVRVFEETRRRRAETFAKAAGPADPDRPPRGKPR